MLQDEFPATDEFPAVDEFPSVLKWRRNPSAVSMSSSLPDLLGNSAGSLSPTDAPLKSEQLEGDKTVVEDTAEAKAPVKATRLMFEPQPLAVGRSYREEYSQFL